MAALIALFYTYNLFGALACLALMQAAVVYRRRLLRDWRFTAVAAAIAAPIALLPTVVAELSGFSATKQLDILGGGVVGLSRSTFAGLALVVIASMATRTGRRSAVWRVLAGTIGLAAVAIAVYRGSTSAVLRPTTTSTRS